MPYRNCLFWEKYKTYKYTVWAEGRIFKLKKPVVYKVNHWASSSMKKKAYPKIPNFDDKIIHVFWQNIIV